MVCSPMPLNFCCWLHCLFSFQYQISNSGIYFCKENLVGSGNFLSQVVRTQYLSSPSYALDLKKLDFLSQIFFSLIIYKEIC